MPATQQLRELLPQLRTIATQAGTAIKQVRSALGDVDEKADGSPVTRADQAAHNIIVPALEKLHLPYPVISEEGDPAQINHCPDSYWLIDPLDGTKEFIKGLDDFTVNIGLIIDQQPALGVVYLPATGTIYYALKNEGAWCRKNGEKATSKLTAPGSPNPLTAVMSRSHGSPETDAFLKKMKVENTIARGSSLKICAVAEGSADLYPRLNPTWYWDTAAGAAIALEAGCALTNPDGIPLTYDLNRGMKHHGFIFYTPKTCQPFQK